MPKSKSKRRKYQPPPKPKPPPSPRWVGGTFFTLLGVGFVTIISRYLLHPTFPILDNNWVLVGGLVLLAGAMVISTRLR